MQVAEDSEEETGAELFVLPLARVKRMLTELGSEPFVAIVFKGNHARVYTKDADPDIVARIMKLLTEPS